MRPLRLPATSVPSSNPTSRRVTAITALTTLFTMLVLIQAALFAPGAHAAAPHVDVVAFDRAVDPAGARYLTDAIQTAESDGAVALVITIDTPGGDLDSMETIVRAELSATVPIISFVSPEAAQAASAGSFIALAAPVAAMAPNTRIGAASPVDASGADLGSTLKTGTVNELPPVDCCAHFRGVAH